MAGYGGMDDASVDAMIFVENHIELCKSLLPKGDSLQYCLECGDEIPKARRLVWLGAKTCVPCQESLDKKRPKIKTTQHIL